MIITNLDVVLLLDRSFKANPSRPFVLRERKTFEINENGPVLETATELLFGIRGGSATRLAV